MAFSINASDFLRPFAMNDKDIFSDGMNQMREDRNAQSARQVNAQNISASKTAQAATQQEMDAQTAAKQLIDQTKTAVEPYRRIKHLFGPDQMLGTEDDPGGPTRALERALSLADQEIEAMTRKGVAAPEWERMRSVIKNARSAKDDMGRTRSLEAVQDYFSAARQGEVLLMQAGEHGYGAEEFQSMSPGTKNIGDQGTVIDVPNKPTQGHSFQSGTSPFFRGQVVDPEGNRVGGAFRATTNDLNAPAINAGTGQPALTPAQVEAGWKVIDLTELDPSQRQELADIDTGVEVERLSNKQVQDNISEIITAGQESLSGLAGDADLIELLANGEFTTGKIPNLAARLGRIFNIPAPNDAEAANAAIDKVLDRMKMLGGSDTEREFQWIKEVSAGAERTIEENMRILGRGMRLMARTASTVQKAQEAMSSGDISLMRKFLAERNEHRKKVAELALQEASRGSSRKGRKNIDADSATDPKAIIQGADALTGYPG